MPLLSLPARFLDRLRGHRVDPELAGLVAWSVDQVDPRLRQAGGYPRRYGPCIAHAWDYCRRLADQVPGPVALNRQAFAQDPVVHALFGSPEGIVQALVRNRPVREWRSATHEEGEVFALMGVRAWEKDILGMEDRDGVLHRDVPQKAVYFSDHTFSNLGVTEAETRALLARQFMASLLARVADRVEELRQHRQRLVQARNELLARLHAHPGSGELRAALKQTLADLSASVAALDPGRHAHHFEAVLLGPEQYLSLDVLTMSLDAMGIHRGERDDAQAQRLDLREMRCRDRRRWVVMLVRCRLDELPPYEERLATAARWLSI